MLGAESGRSFVIAGAVNGLVWLVIGICLYARSESIAARLFPGTEQLSISATADQLQEVGFGLLAVYFIVDATARLGGLVYIAIKGRPEYESQFEHLWSTNREGLVIAVVELVFGIGLFLGVRGIATLARKVRATPTVDSGA